ncbi:MAG: ribose-phosphate diphosphokinase [Candidatus Ancillula sp.]|jgi:ribose-phosphate pyrophosphokinase|nr:ribose-phosphate diphosphokinase [Candidatus Ancillula sp.]
MSHNSHFSGKLTPELVLVAGRSHPELATAVAENLGINCLNTTIYDFANGELYVHYKESVRGCDVFVLQTHTDPMNKNIMEQLIMIDALKRASAKSINVICPFLGYSRQDKKHYGREPISARLIFDLFTAAGATRIMSIDLHSAQLQGFFNGPVDHLYGMPILTEYIRRRVDLENVVVVSPDAGRIRVAEQWAERFNNAPLAFIHKTRDISQPNVVKHGRVVGDVAGKECVITDDLIDTGGTIVGAVKALYENGAKSVIVAATHGILSDPARERLMNSGVTEVVVTDTLPISQEKRFEQLTILSVAPLLAQAARAVFESGSVTSLLNAHDVDVQNVIKSALKDLPGW